MHFEIPNVRVYFDYCSKSEVQVERNDSSGLFSGLLCLATERVSFYSLFSRTLHTMIHLNVFLHIAYILSDLPDIIIRSSSRSILRSKRASPGFLISNLYRQL